MMLKKLKENKLHENIRSLLISARQDILEQLNKSIVNTYFNIGKMIIEDEQNGKEKAKYGKDVLKILSNKLIKEFGRGFSVDNLENMRKFYITYNKSSISSRTSQKSQTVSGQFNLSWSHYVFLINLDEPIRKFYEIESIQNNWSLRELKRQFDSSLYERLSLSRDKKKILELSKKGQIIEKPEDLIKQPFVFEFVGLKEESQYSESDLESRLISNLEKFLLELGKGYTFVARQQRISFSDEHFYIDLVFYNRHLKCFVIFDLKIGKLKHQDIGQLQMYVNYYDRKVKMIDENRTIGILLCTDKNDAVVEMTLPEDNNHLFASKYKLYLPTKEQLIKQIKI